jgi:hypothetical protein
MTMIIDAAKGLRPRITAKLREKLPCELRRELYWRYHRLLRPAWLGTLRRTTPLGDDDGFDRGTPIDRYYIDRFLQEHQRDIYGRVLEVKDRYYSTRYNTIEHSDVLDIDPTNADATIVADLAVADVIPSERFDCFILTQTLQLIYDTHAALAHAHRILRSGGVLLVSVPAVSRVDPASGLDGDYWRFTAASCRALFGAIFGAENVVVRSYGNVLAAIAFLAGIAAEELSLRELNVNDDYSPLVITVRAVKA